jgi:hypothetical protein
MLNAKYVIYNPDAPPLINRKALGNAWFVENPVLVENANEEISQINRIDPSKVAVIDKRFKDLVTRSSYTLSPGDTIGIKSYEPNELIYNSKSAEEKLAVFSEIYYPAGWISSIDGKVYNYFRADYVLRAMVVPEGNHEIKFIFKPASYIIGNRISLASSILLILLLAGYLAMKIIKK